MGVRIRAAAKSAWNEERKGGRYQIPALRGRGEDY
jgi:hypothetical protein